jgi:hypothetical protein
MHIHILAYIQLACAIAQAVSRRLPTALVRGQASQVWKVLGATATALSICPTASFLLTHELWNPGTTSPFTITRDGGAIDL